MNLNFSRSVNETIRTISTGTYSSPAIKVDDSTDEENIEVDDKSVVTMGNGNCAKPNGTTNEMVSRKIKQKSGAKLFKCRKCKYTTDQSHRLKRHAINHKNKKSYKCTICANKYTTKASLKRHMCNVHK